MEQRIARFFPAAPPGRQVGSKQDRFGFISLHEGRVFLTEELNQKEAADAVLFVQQSLELASVSEVWNSNVYDFCRLLQQAKGLHAEKLRAIEKANKKSDARGY